MGPDKGLMPFDNCHNVQVINLIERLAAKKP